MRTSDRWPTSHRLSVPRAFVNARIPQPQHGPSRASPELDPQPDHALRSSAPLFLIRIGWQHHWIPWRPGLHLGLRRCLCLLLSLFSCLKGVIVIVFVVFGVVVSLEDDLVPPLVGLHMHLDVTSWRRTSDLDVLQARITSADERFERLPQRAAGEIDVCERPALVHSHAAHLAPESCSTHHFPALECLGVSAV